MISKKPQTSQRDRFLKLSLKKNKMLKDLEVNRDSPDVVLIEESFEKLKTKLTKTVEERSQNLCSPIVLDDSSELSSNDDVPISNDGTKKPSQQGNVSFNHSFENPIESPQNKSRPSIGGWSQVQNIICATPKHHPIPSTNKDIANESIEECSIKKIQQSQKKILDDLYGEVWKSIPKLFKPKTSNNIDCISKKLEFDDESDKENVRENIRKLKQDILTDSEVKRKGKEYSDTDKTSRKKLYTEKVVSTPNVPKQRNPTNRNAVTTTKKLKHMSVTELVDVMKKDVDIITKKVEKVNLTPAVEIKRLTFIGSLADNVPSWRCNFEAMQYIDNYKKLRDQLTRRLYKEFNEGVFNDQLDADMALIWDTKLRSTAGTTTNRLIKSSSGERFRTSSIKLSTKVIDRPQRLRDTLIHELCHAATWLIDGELRAGHGPLWKRWATRALKVFPELGEISRCHDMEIHYKYCFKCTKCGYSIKRHSKSIDITKKCCGYCRGTFELIVNKKNKDGLIVSTPARKGGPNDFALYVKENYGAMKDATKTHAQVMRTLGEQFSARKKMAENT